MRKYIYILLLTHAGAGTCMQVYAQAPTPVEQQFHFWQGEWVVYKTGTDSAVGQSSITPLYGGVALKESYQSDNNAYLGTSLNIYHAQRNRWEQYYIDSDGFVLHIHGQWQDGQMCMDDLKDPPNAQLRNRICWTPAADGTVRQVWEQSVDAGLTWKVAFDGTYVRKKP